jgi:hypothetical protein
VSAAVYHRCFNRAAALLRGLLAFQELLEPALLLRLGLRCLACQQLLPALRGSLSEHGLAVSRAEAIVSPLPAAWFTPVPPQEARPLLDVLASLGRSLEAALRSSSGGGGAMPGYARRVAALLAHVGLREQAAGLAAAAAAAACG